MNTKIVHKADCARVFKNYDLTCPRCQQLIEGFPARSGWNNRRKNDMLQVQAIRQHDCKVSHCGPVCTFGEW